MLPESLKAVVLAGEEALQETCGLPVVSHQITMLRQGSLHFPAIAELNLKGAPIQKVHLGCDEGLAAILAGQVDDATGQNGLEAVSSCYLQQLVSRLEARNPRGTARHLGATPVELVSRGLRSFGIILETGSGQFFILCEIPSRLEMETAKGSDYLRAMEATYLPRDWGNRAGIDGALGVGNFVTFVRKVECDVAFEIAGQRGEKQVHHGILLEHGTINGVRGLKFCSDLNSPLAAGLQPGTRVPVSVGVEDRSLSCTMEYLGEGSHAVADPAEVPCLIFAPPTEVSIAQRRLAFRIPVDLAVRVELRAGDGAGSPSPWGDRDPGEDLLVSGRLGDLSFGGARIVVDPAAAGLLLELNSRVTCDLYLPGPAEPVSVLCAVRRFTSRLVDRNEWQHEVGLEFLVSQDEDHSSLEQVRQFVLAQQRNRLAKRINVSGVPV